MTARPRRIAFLLSGVLLAAPLHAAEGPVEDEDASSLDRALPAIGTAGDQAPVDESTFDAPAPPPPPIDLDYRVSPQALPGN